MTAQVMIGLSLASACALTTNAGALFKHRGANAVPAFEVRRPLHSCGLLLRSRWFALGLAVAVFAGVLHIAALALAPISIVQAVVAGGVAVLAGLAERLLGCRVPRRQRIGLIAGAAGLVLLVVSVPRLTGAHGGFGSETLGGFEALTALVGLTLALGPRARRVFAHRGVLLGAAGGAFFGLSDVAVKAITGLVERGAPPATTAPWLAVAIAAGIAAQILAVKGLQEGEAVPVIALTGVTANIANIAGGMVVFGDPLGHGPLGVAAESLAFLLVVIGSALLAGPALDRPSVRPAARSPRLV